jgi:hypothetical protein
MNKEFLKGFGLAVLIWLLSIQIREANAIGAQLENITIKDMYFGFVVCGQIANSKYWTLDYSQADRISTEMMSYRGKKL